MRPKILIWTGIAIILLTLGILITWAAFAGFFPRIEINPKGLVILPPRLDIKAANLLDFSLRMAVVPLQMLSTFLQLTLTQFTNAFVHPYP